jgi:hypothetical protein
VGIQCHILRGSARSASVIILCDTPIDNRDLSLATNSNAAALEILGTFMGNPLSDPLIDSKVRQAWRNPFHASRFYLVLLMSNEVILDTLFLKNSEEREVIDRAPILLNHLADIYMRLGVLQSDPKGVKEVLHQDGGLVSG